MKKILIYLFFSLQLFADSLYVREGYTYNPQSCSNTCEEVKEGYFTRVVGLNLPEGIITCNIYSEKEPLKVLETRKIVNQICKQEYTFIPDRSLESPDALRLDTQLEALQTKYFKNFINTGNAQYLTAPEYLVAILTADADVINIKETLEENRIVLNQGYTIFPNEQKEYEANFIQKIFDFFSEINPFSDDEKQLIPVEKYPLKLTSSTSQLISTIGVFWLDFLTETNFLYQETNFLIVMIIAPFSLLILMGETWTQRISKVDGANNWVGAGIVSAFVCLTMFLSYNVAKTGEEDFLGREKNLDQSFYQDNTGYMFTNGVQIANSFNAGFNKVYINQMARNASVNPNLTQEERIQKYNHLNNLSTVYDSYLDVCANTYDTTTLQNIASNLYATPMSYPPNETYNGISFYRYLKNQDDLIKNNLYSVEFCYEMHRQKSLLALKIHSLSKEIQNSKKALEDGMEERILNIAEVAYKNTVEMGFFSALTTSAMNATLSNLEEYQHYSDDIDAKREYIENETRKAMKTYSDVSASDLVDNDLISLFPKYIPYFAMPFFSDIYQGVSKMANLGGSESKEASGHLGIMGKFILKLAKATPFYTFLESLISIGTPAIVLAVSIWIYEYFLELLLPFAILSAGLLAVLFWIAEIVIYYLVIPFMFAHAMVKGQGEAISKFLSRGLIISARPTLIVFSIIVAILLNELYEAISIFVITKNFSAIFGLNELGMIDTFTGLIQQGFFELALKLIIPVIMFFVILIGSTLFLKQFGYTDEAEFGQQLQNSLESRGGRYNLPV